jgi:hypothetical protein
MENRRRFLRLEVRDFLEIRPLNELAQVRRGNSFNLALLGICFFSEVKWERGQVLLIDYFIPDDLDSVRLKVAVVWSEFVSDRDGYLTGAEVINVDKEKELKFVNYYFQKIKERFFR